ncbi:MAG: CDP-alcohol phosphatidyltransferase family protein, partial [Sphingomonadaceae bacterium]|nr:CDP-alcohol phosphatidyltransferase family protein [Sphingomonadaceae bacterium]
MPDDELKNRRPLASRSTGWAAIAARAILAAGLSPNAISVIGIGFAALGAWALVEAPRQPWLYLAAALGIQLRLLCNMLDGMVAVEGGKGSATGPLYNEAPDRIEDTLLLVAAGYACGYEWAGWLAAVFAMFTAYVRALGGSMGFAQDFRGPMAKPHRMAVLTAGCIVALGVALMDREVAAIAVALALIIVGSAITGIRRTFG